MEAALHPWPALGALMLRDGLVTREVLEGVLDEQRDSPHQRISGKRLGEALVERGVVTSVQVAQLVAEQYALPFLELTESEVSVRAAVLLPEEIAYRLSALPVSVLPDGSLLVALGDPPLALFSDELNVALGVPLRFAVAASDAVERAITFAYERARLLAVTDVKEPASDDAAEIEDSVAAPPTPSESDDSGGSPPPFRLTRPWPALGALLIRDGVVTEEELETALAQQRVSGSRRLGEVLVERGTVSRTDVARLVAEQYELPFVDLVATEVETDVALLLSEDLARRHSAIPINARDGQVLVALADPTTVLDAHDLKLAFEMPVRFVGAPPEAVDAAITLVHAAPATVHEISAEPHTEPDDTTVVELVEVDEEFDEAVAENVVEATASVLRWDAARAPHQSQVPGTLALVETDGSAEADAAAEDAAETEVPVESDVASEAEVVSEANVSVDADVPVVPDTPVEIELMADVVPVVPDTPVEVEHSDDVEPEPETEAATEVETTDDASGALQALLGRALSIGASHVHFVPRDDELVVRARVDGVMREVETLATHDGFSVVQELKALGQLGTADRRTPWEGRIAYPLEDAIVDLQLVIVPTKRGEKMTVTVGDPRSTRRSLSDLGLTTDGAETLRSALAERCGAIVICGPMQSGKTSTLYAALQELDTTERTVMTVERPVEYVLGGVDQIEVNPAVGLTSARGINAALHSDPDVIAVGEVRDEETALLTLRAATMGRLVLATMEARTTALAVRQLSHLCTEPFLVGSALTHVVSQRLMRRICSSCRETYYADAEELAELGRPAEEAGKRLLARGRGCAECDDTGFRGLVGVFEMLSVTAEIRTLVDARSSVEDIEQAARAAGMQTLAEDAARLCLEGITTSAEIRRVLGPQPL